MATTYATRARRLGDRFAGAAKSGLWTSVYTIQSSIRFLYTVAGILAGGTQGILEGSKLIWTKSLQPAVASRLERLASHPKILPLARTYGLTSRRTSGGTTQDAVAPHRRGPEVESRPSATVTEDRTISAPVPTPPQIIQKETISTRGGPIHQQLPLPAANMPFAPQAPLKGGTDSSPLSSYPATPKLSAEISSTPPATPGRLEAPTAPLPAVAKHDLASHPVDGSSSKDSTPTKKRRGPIAGPVHKVSKELKKMFK